MELPEILLMALLLSEALALTPFLKSNSILQMVIEILRKVAPKKKEQLEEPKKEE